MSSKIAIAIPCYNEEVTIESVVKDFRGTFPDAKIYVFNNNSTDKTVEFAQKAGAIVYHVLKQGKGHVMRAIFDILQEDILIVIDGDGTYIAEDAPKLLEPVLRGDADMVVGNRLASADEKSLMQLNRFGNHLIVKLLNITFGTNYKDILSGYRIFNRRFIERVPLFTPSFETETEITLQALEKELTVVELPITYLPRPTGSSSKLSPFRDGWNILLTIVILLRDHQPLRFYGSLGLLSLITASAAIILKTCDYYQIIHFSDSFVAGVILLFAPIGVILLGIGVILNAINTKFKEVEQLKNRKKIYE